MTTRTKALLAFGLLALAAALFYVFSGGPTMETLEPTKATVSTKNAERLPRRPRENAASEKDAAKSADAATQSADTTGDQAKWPIGVTTNVPGAQVTLQIRRRGGEADPPPETKTTDAKGFVGFASPAKDVDVAQLEFVARAEAWTTTRVSADAAGDVRIDLARGIALRGRVVDEAGRPVREPSLVALQPAAWCVDASSTSNTNYADAEGVFEAFVGEPGPVSFRVEDPAFLPKQVAAVAPAAELVVVLERGLEISGRVEFPDHRPLPGGTITNHGVRRLATTDEDGRFVVSGLSRGPVELVCFETHEGKTVDAGAAGVTFVVHRSVARVRFLDAKGRPFRFAATTVRVAKGGVDLDTSVSSGRNEDNDELVSGDAGASVVVTASGTAGETGSASVTFGAEPRLVDLDVVIGASWPTGTIRLLVRWDSAEMPRAAYVEVEDETGNTVAGDSRKRLDLDAAGAVEIPNVPAGHVVVVVADTAHWSTDSLDTFLVTVHAGAEVEAGRTTEVHATLVVGGRVRAAVRDEDGKPVAPDVVRLATSSNGHFLDMFIHRNADGGWTTELDTSPSVLLDAVPPGRYVVRTTGPAGDEVSKEVDVVKGETADVVLTVKTKR